MSLLYSVVFASRCRSNHHRLAVDALRHLQSPNADAWRELLLHQHVAYLGGAKAPDEEFKDFKNHVLHVRDGDWGGAVEACEEWYRRGVRALKEQDWKHAAWCLGVMSHYYVDPIQPFHTHQTEEEGVIHRAVEWSFSKSYKTFQQILERDLGGYPNIVAPTGDRWLARMVKNGALASNPHYETILDHYNFEKGVKDPPSGLDQELKDVIAKLVGHAAVGLSRILDRAFEEAAVKPPRIIGPLDAFFLALEMPIQSVLKLMDDAASRKEVEAQYEEFRRTGKVRKTLGEDDKVVRALYAAEVLQTPLSSLDAKWPRETGAKAGEGAAPRGRKRAAPKPKPATPAAPEPMKAEAPPKPVKVEPPKIVRAEPPQASVAAAEPPPKAEKSKAERAVKHRGLPDLPPGARPPNAPLPKFLLDGAAPVEKAPSIGPKTAKRLESLGVRTVADLLALQPEKSAALEARHITAQVVRDWQAQATLACTVPGLKSREAQALVACGVRDANELAKADALELTEDIAHWGLSDEGQRAWGSAPAPTEHDVADWIELANRALHSKADAA